MLSDQNHHILIVKRVKSVLTFKKTVFNVLLLLLSQVFGKKYFWSAVHYVIIRFGHNVKAQCASWGLEVKDSSTVASDRREEKVLGAGRGGPSTECWSGAALERWMLTDVRVPSHSSPASNPSQPVVVMITIYC